MKPIDFARLASCLRRVFNQNRNRISLAKFQQELKPVLNAAESSRLFGYYCDQEEVLVPIDKRFFRWHNIHEDHFNPDAIRDIFLKEDIRSHYGRQKKVAIRAAIVPEQQKPILPAPIQETEIVPRHLEEILSEVGLIVEELSILGYSLIANGTKFGVTKDVCPTIWARFVTKC